MIELREQVAGRWVWILEKLGIDHNYLTNKHGPCPACGGVDEMLQCEFTDRGHPNRATLALSVNPLKVLLKEQNVKICSKCLVPKDKAQFSKGNAKDGLQYRCKSCYADWVNQNKDKCQERQRILYNKNPRKTIERTKAWRDANPDEYKKQNADYYAANRDARKQATRMWVKLNPEKKKEADKAYALANKEKVKIIRKRWADANPEYRSMAKSRRRALEMGAPGSHTSEHIKNLMSLQKKKCACCKSDLNDGYHVDHKTALVNGGSNDKLNLQLLCPPCNMSKSSKDEIKFMQSRGFLI